MLDWGQLGQLKFDQIVEALLRDRLGDQVRAVNGIGGDDGIDVEVTRESGRLWILQLKYFPEGFSSVYRQRRSQIKRSFASALKHSPAEWTLVVPRLCTNYEDKFVKNLNGGKKPPKITIVDRDDLDSWLVDAPRVEQWAHRTVTTELRQMAQDFNLERAALLGGVPDLASRVNNLGRLADSTDLDWKLGFANSDDATSVTISPRHPLAGARSPIQLSVELDPLGDEHAELKQELLQSFSYSPSGRFRIPAEVVRSVRFDGPEFISGDWPPGAVEIVSPPTGRAVGEILEVRAYQSDDLVATFEGSITHSAPGAAGVSIEAAFCGGNLDVRLRLPHGVDEPADIAAPPGIDLNLNYGSSVRPSVVEDTLSTRRVLCFATNLEFHFMGKLLAKFGKSSPPDTDAYDHDLMAIEQYAHDLDIVQRHTNRFFDIPEEIEPGDRVRLRVARLLVEGYIVASPRAPIFNMTMTGRDVPEVRAALLQPQSIVWPAGPFSVKVAGRDLAIGDVYAVHPRATAVNGDEAIAALDAGEADGFEVRFRPGDDPYFFLTLAKGAPEEVMTRYLAQWTLHGIEQPGVLDDDDSFELT